MSEKKIKFESEVTFKRLDIQKMRLFGYGKRDGKKLIFSSDSLNGTDYVLIVVKNHEAFVNEPFYILIGRWGDITSMYDSNFYCNIKYIGKLEEYDEDNYVSPFVSLFGIKDTKIIEDRYLLSKKIFQQYKCKCIMYYKGVTNEVKQMFDNSLTNVTFIIDKKRNIICDI